MTVKFRDPLSAQACVLVSTLSSLWLEGISDGLLFRK
jgi:hypothetical protein